MAQLYLLLELAGMDMRDWSMSQGPNPYLMSVPSNRDADLATDLAVVVPELFQKLQPSLMAASSYGSFQLRRAANSQSAGAGGPGDRVHPSGISPRAHGYGRMHELS